MNLDFIDKKLLFELDLGARNSLGQLGRKLRLSKNAVSNRIKNLEKEEIILGYRAIINSSKLGKYYFRIFIAFRQLTPEIRKEIEDYICADTHFGYVYRSEGKYDYSCAVWIDDLYDFQRITDEIYFKWGQYIQEIFQDMPLAIIDLQNRYLLNVKEGKRQTMNADIENIELDNMEKGILYHLSQNGRMPIHELAKKLGATGKQITYRIKKLERIQVIQGYRALINYRKLGYSYFKCRISLVQYTKKEYDLIRNTIMDDSRVMFIVNGINVPTIDISAVFTTIEEFYEFMENLKNQFPGKIGQYEIILFGKAVKIDYAPFLKPMEKEGNSE